MEEIIQPALTDKKLFLFNVVASCLLKETRYYDSQDQRRVLIQQTLTQVAETDPEFICMLAVYLRHKMYLRTTTNYILAFCVTNPNTQPFIETYFHIAVPLPGDLLEVCQFVQLQGLSEEEIKSNPNIRQTLKFPKTLQKCAQNAFEGFSTYQLGKYCSQGHRKSQLKKYKYSLDPSKREKDMLKKKERKLNNLLKKTAIKQDKDKQDGQVEVKEDPDIKQQIPQVKQGIKIRKVMKRHGKQRGPAPIKSTIESKYITMKDVIRFCHISKPQKHVVAILGKKYPTSESDFQKMFHQDFIELEKDGKEQQKKDDEDGIPDEMLAEKGHLLEFQQNLKKFNAEMSNRRIKLPIPDTWETQVSKYGNQPEVWTELVTQKKLPYMAMIRNLRNILKSGVSDQVHNLVVDAIKNPKLVENSKMFPLQFFNALSEVEIAATKGIKQRKSGLLIGMVEHAQKHMKPSDGQQNKPYNRRRPDDSSDSSDSEEEDKDVEFVKISKENADQYQNSIEEAIKIATQRNLDTIAGHTAVFADVSGSMKQAISGGKQYGSIGECFEIGLLLGLMIQSRCQHCTFYIFSSGNPSYIEVKQLNGTLLENMEHLSRESQQLEGGTDFPYQEVDQWIEQQIQVDNAVILSDMMISESYGGIDSSNIAMRKYIDTINPNFQVFSIDLTGYGSGLDIAQQFEEKNFIRIFGMSDTVLKYINAAEGDDQIKDVVIFAKEALENYLQKKLSQKQQ